jgi:2,4-dienoyl-CoA reductase-like NADH-dependent reductase (Old Yellow Enzyme family)
MASSDFVKIPALSSADAFRRALAGLAISLPCDGAPLAAPGSPLAAPIEVLGRTLPNRFCVQPMEGWDGTPDGRPSELTFRRWRRFGMSGAALVWGGEAVAVRHDGRANPCQLVLTEKTADDLARLREALVAAHRRSATEPAGTPLVGLQLTHSGRFCRPKAWDRPEPVIAFHHPILDRRVGVDSSYAPISDGELRHLVADFARAARVAQRCGFDFVDLKHCHGYLGHELLGAHTRAGDYGGALENRTRFLREMIQAVHAEAPGLGIGVRVSVYDTVPYEPDVTQSAGGKLGPGIPADHCSCMPYVYGFGMDPEQPTEMDLTEPIELLAMLGTMGVTLVNVTAGSPYYSHHIQRPALYPPSDGYQPPEDPLVGVARQMHVTRYLKELNPGLTMVGTAYTYLQEYLPHVAQAAVREGWTDFVGIGRMVLSYPELPADLLSGQPLRRKQLCRTLSDCTTAPRAGIASGCYPLDEHYRNSEDARRLALAKAATRARLER